MKPTLLRAALLSFAVLISALSQAQLISTFAGINGSYTATGDGGAATSASTGNPNGIAMDRSGNVYFTDGTNHVVRKVNTSGVITTIAGTGSAGYSGDGGPATSARLYFPQGLCVDASGNVYVADETNLVVRKISTSGIITTVVGTGASGHSGDGGPATAATLPSVIDVAIDRAGNLYVADGYFSVRKVNTSGIISLFAGTTYGYTGDGGRADTATLDGPTAVDADTAGNIYIADNQNMVVRKVSPSGIITTVAGNGVGAGMRMGGSFGGDGGPATAAGLDQPYGLCVTRNGDIFIADQYNSRIRFVNSANGIISSYAGNGYVTYAGDGGRADTAALNYPVDCAVDTLGTLYIADRDNNVVRKVDAPYRVTVSTPNDTVCSGTAVVYTAVVTAPRAGYHYHWFKNTAAVGTDANTYTADSVHTGDTVKCILIGTTSTDTLAISNVIRMFVRTTVTPTIAISASPSGAICSGVTVTFNAAITGGGSAPVYHWSVNGSDSATTSSYTYRPANGDVVQCRLNSSLSCISAAVISSSTITMTVTPTVTPGITIATATDTVCTAAPTIFTATIVNGGSAPHYQWFANSTTVGGDSAVLHYTPSTGDVISCRLTSNVACRTADTIRSNRITMTITTPRVPSVTIYTIGGDTSCVGAVDTIVATAVNGGTSPTFDWIVNSFFIRSGNPFIYSPTSGDVVWCTLTPSGCVTVPTVNSNVLTLRVISYTTPTVSVARSADTICAGDTVTFTASSTSGGSAPVYNWYKNTTYRATGVTYRDAPTASDVYYCQLVSNAHCNTTDTVVSSNITFVINPIVTPSVTIAASPSGAVCAGTTVTFTPSPTFGGSAPSYTWYKNGTVVGTGSTYAYVPATGDSIKCKLTSSARCTSSPTAFSSSIIMTVTPVVATTLFVTSVPGDTVCAGTTITFAAHTTGGGSAPGFQWFKNGTAVSGATDSTYTMMPAMGDSVVCRYVSSTPCARPDTIRSAAHRLVVNPVVTPAVSITAAPGFIVCVGTSVTFTAGASGTGSAPTYQWKVNGTVVGSASTYVYTPTNGDVITCRITSNAPCRTGDSATSSPVTMIVNAYGPPSVTIHGYPSDTFCVGHAAVFRPYTTTGGSAPTYKWYVNGVYRDTGASFSYTPTAGDLVKCLMHSTSPCATPDSAYSNTITVIISSYVTPAVAIATPLDTVCSGLPITYTPTPVNGGALPTYDWYVNGVLMGTGSTYTYSPTTGDRVSCKLHSTHPCATPDTAMSNVILMTVTPSVVPVVTITASPGTSITYGTSVTFSSSAVNAGSFPTYQWLLNGAPIPGATNPNYITDSLHNGDIVSCVMASSAPCAIPPFDTSNTEIITITNVGVTKVTRASGLVSLQPNPNSGSFLVKSDMLAVDISAADITVTNMLGEKVYHVTAPVNNGKLNAKISLANDLANGMYLLNIKYDGGNEVLHFVIEK